MDIRTTELRFFYIFVVCSRFIHVVYIGVSLLVGDSLLLVSDNTGSSIPVFISLVARALADD